MRVLVNGAVLELRDGASVTDAVAAVRPRGGEGGIAVAVNGSVVPRSAWPETNLAPDDQVEVLTAVAGG